MDERDFDELLKQARQVAGYLAEAYRDVTGEEIDLDGIVRHYPLVAVGVAAGVGAIGGWLVARRSQRRLPPPKMAPTPLEYVERLVPEGIERVRDILPGLVADDAAERATAWMGEVLEPRLKESVDSVMANVSETRLGLFLRQTIERLDTGEDRQLEDPD